MCSDKACCSYRGPGLLEPLTLTLSHVVLSRAALAPPRVAGVLSPPNPETWPDDVPKLHRASPSSSLTTQQLFHGQPMCSHASLFFVWPLCLSDPLLLCIPQPTPGRPGLFFSFHYLCGLKSSLFTIPPLP